MKILAMDTSSKNASVAILENQKVLIELNNSDEKTHSQKLMPIIDQAFQKTNLSLDDIQLLSCSLGPGSFTGVRIGIATSKAFADSKNIPCVGITSLEGLAYNLNHEGFICSLLNANHDNVYAGFFHIKRNKNINYMQSSDYLEILESDYTFLDLKDTSENVISQPIYDFIENNSKVKIDDSPIYFVGDASIIYQNLLENLNFKKHNNIILAAPNFCEISSISIAKAGYAKYKNGNYGNSSILTPVYLRKSQAELSLEQDKLNNNK